jgi:hypothetical protein
LAGRELNGGDAGGEGGRLPDDGQFPAGVVSWSHGLGGFQAERTSAEAAGSVGRNQGGVERSLWHSKLSRFLVIHLEFGLAPIAITSSK